MSGKLFFVLFLATTISAEQIQIHTRIQQTKNTEPITVDFSLRPSRAVVGQKLTGKLVVTYDPRRVSIRGLELPKWDDLFFHEPFDGPRREQIDVNGQAMMRLIWSTQLYPKKTGVFNVTGLTVQYGRTDSSPQRGGFGDFFSWAFQHQDDRLYTATSKEVAITIDQVPSSQSVDAIGDYHSCVAILDRVVLDQGEAATLSVEVKGAGNAGFEPSFSPEIPAGCTWYRDGTRRSQDGARFAFVVQCNQAGVVQIPPQKFTCYNPFTKKINVLTSSPLAITVNQGKQQHEKQSLATDMPIEPEIENTVEKKQHCRSVPWAMIGLVCFIMLTASIFCKIKKYTGQIFVYIRYLICRKVAVIKIRYAAWRGKLVVREAYYFLVTYSDYLSVDSAWQDFWGRLQAYYFGGQQETLLSRAEGTELGFWIKKLKKSNMPVRAFWIFSFAVLLIASIGLFIVSFVHEHGGELKRLSIDAPLYLGPGSGYPIRKGLVAGDEVRVVRSLPDKKTGSWIFVDACGEKGWLLHDVFV